MSRVRLQSSKSLILHFSISPVFHDSRPPIPRRQLKAFSIVSASSFRSSSRPPTCSPRRSSPDRWCTFSALGTAVFWWRKCGRATAPSRASIPSLSSLSPFTISSSARTASGRPCSSKTSVAWRTASCGTSISMPGDSALVISSGGCNVVPVEMAEEFQKRGVKVVCHHQYDTQRGQHQPPP
jgi:hypothetical protein